MGHASFPTLPSQLPKLSFPYVTSLHSHISGWPFNVHSRAAPKYHSAFFSHFLVIPPKHLGVEHSFEPTLPVYFLLNIFHHHSSIPQWRLLLIKHDKCQNYFQGKMSIFLEIKQKKRVKDFTEASSLGKGSNKGSERL